MKRIVIADDSATARMVIRRCLEIIGLGDAGMVEVPNGREALARLKEEPADLLVTDLNMPIMDGETLLKWVKGSPKLNHVPVVVITSAGNPAKEALLSELGAFAVLDKPISPATLLKKLEPLMQ
ncbi:MAG: response regulator [Syntrophotalea acetylenica]|uniref:Histidine kinase n=1 Tax=Syntrophotalea acetylenica TaxID=29542 RepID=A0A1L3GCR2_SYNAC|nr:response regulator [Syntrophotalea acetylenica]APG23697.1 histidine kinase [Syntrophotalea acetylenica]APG44274.1 histidine kinase [Syntrophotalea acetylenica]MDD4456683.1 response regulator [Syntrophotalea acetylenica]MDY0262837.1 response regulator [Syntrophotalea acetylenica]